jgi:hypothetical protein
MLSITLAIGLVGLIFLLFPDRIKHLEDKLNAPWGDQEVTALRIGMPGEQAVEQVINRNVLDQKVTWDGWTRNHPRIVGAVLCLVAAVLGWQL